MRLVLLPIFALVSLASVNGSTTDPDVHDMAEASDRHVPAAPVPDAPTLAARGVLTASAPMIAMWIRFMIIVDLVKHVDSLQSDSVVTSGLAQPILNLRGILAAYVLANLLDRPMPNLTTLVHQLLQLAAVGSEGVFVLSLLAAATRGGLPTTDSLRGMIVNACVSILAATLDPATNPTRSLAEGMRISLDRIDQIAGQITLGSTPFVFGGIFNRSFMSTLSMTAWYFAGLCSFWRCRNQPELI